MAKGSRRSSRRSTAAGAESPGGAAAGRSILSMLGRSDLVGLSNDSRPTEAPPAAAPASASPGQERHGKLSVAELFNLAQGKDLPPLPNNANAEARNAERHAQQEASKMPQLMWLAAQQQQQWQHHQQQQQSQLQAAGRHPGSVPSAHAVGASSGGYGGAFAVAGDNLFQEAYTQAMLGFGQGVHPVAGATAMATVTGASRIGPEGERGSFEGQQGSHRWSPQPMASGCSRSANPWGYEPQQSYRLPFGPTGPVGPGGCLGQPPVGGQAPLGGLWAQAATSSASTHAPASGLGAGTWPSVGTHLDATQATHEATHEAVEDESGCSQS